MASGTPIRADRATLARLIQTLAQSAASSARVAKKSA